MITEDYVSFETAKLLKEKGFEYNPDESYWLIDANNKMYWVSCIGAYDYVDVPTESFQRPKNGYRLVTQAMAMKWLRKVHNLHVEVHYNTFWDYYQYIILYRGEKIESDMAYHSFEDAAEAVIKFCIKKLI